MAETHLYREILDALQTERICVHCQIRYRPLDNLTELGCLTHNSNKKGNVYICCQIDRKRERDKYGNHRTISNYPESGCTSCIHTSDPKVRGALERLENTVDGEPVIAVDRFLVDNNIIEIDKTRIIRTDDEHYYLTAFGKLAEFSYFNYDYWGN